MALKKKKKVRKAAKKPVKKPAKKRVKKTAKKPAKRKPLLKKKPAAKKKRTGKKAVKKEEGNLIGSITHYFPHVQAAVIKLKGPLAMGDTLKIKGHTTDLTQLITSMQIDRVDISSAKKGDEIGLLVNSRVRQHDKVYKV
ncbi:MAG: hypothetical protein PHP10_03560 [Candidatus Omnitrophica bacterium]|nr:hypothetical protein [Candidatus Omnitrophota bacterium]